MFIFLFQYTVIDNPIRCYDLIPSREVTRVGQRIFRINQCILNRVVLVFRHWFAVFEVGSHYIAQVGL